MRGKRTESGMLLVDKAAGWTSHDVVAYIRRFGFKKVGHCGTLDPDATGLLLIVVGKGTKLSQQLSGDSKIYEATLKLGNSTSTQDASGAVTAEGDYTNLTHEEIEEVVMSFMGPGQQIPPMVSALKHKGKRLYELEREGIEVERPPRNIEIHELKISRIEPPEVDFCVHCSKGVYVRTLCHDIGEKLGCHGHMSNLRRTKSGAFSIENSSNIEAIKEWDLETLLAKLIPLEEIPGVQLK
ncbi:MAG: tRNA pseudouridine(55) synthase TruB [Lentisphaeria bacterium]|nr:tRNA pseudouridine(55) synthase TruB [Lentisphaeria bacterium]